MTRSRTFRRCALLALAIGLLSIGVAAPVAGAAGAAGSGTALQDDGTVADDPDVTIDADESDHHTAWAGQTVAFEGFEPGEVVRFTHESDYRERTAGGNGTFRSDTTAWETGSWTVVGNESGSNVTVALREQELDASIDDSDAASGTATLVLDSNRAGYDVGVTGLTAESLAAAVDGGRMVDGQFQLSVDDPTGEFAIDTDALPAGTFDLEFAATDAIVVTTASLDVASGVQIGEHEPRPHENGALHVDVTGDGSVGQGDIATFFRRQHRSAWKRPALFDFSDNGAVTHGDVVALADYVATGQLPVDEDAVFVGGPFVEHEGDVAELTLAVEGTGEAWVNVTYPDADYTATVHLADVGGQTTIRANTFLMGDGEAMRAFTGEDVVGFEETGTFADLPDNPHQTGKGWFRIRAYADDPTDGASAEDDSRLVIEERSTDDLTTYVAPADALEGDVEAPADLLEHATRSDIVAEGDVLVAEVEASGVYGYLNETTDDYDASDGGLAVTFTTEQQGPFGTQQYRADLANVSNAELVADEANDRFLVAVPTTNLSLSRVSDAGDGRHTVDAGDELEVAVELDGDNPYVTDGANDSVAHTVSVQERALEFAGDFDENGRLQVANDSDATIVAETTVAPGTESSFYIETQDNIFQGDFVVQEGGTVSAAIDGSDGDAGDIMPAIAFSVGDTSAVTEGVFVPETGPWIVPSGSAPSTVTVGDDASFDATVENRGTAPDEVPVSVAIDGEEVGNYTVELAADASMSATFDLPTDEAGEVTWEIDVGTATDSGTVTVEEPAS